jgi:hypothetical protein
MIQYILEKEPPLPTILHLISIELDGNKKELLDRIKTIKRLSNMAYINPIMGENQAVACLEAVIRYMKQTSDPNGLAFLFLIALNYSKWLERINLKKYIDIIGNEVMVECARYCLDECLYIISLAVLLELTSYSYFNEEEFLSVCVNGIVTLTLNTCKDPNSCDIIMRTSLTTLGDLICSDGAYNWRFNYSTMLTPEYQCKVLDICHYVILKKPNYFSYAIRIVSQPDVIQKFLIMEKDIKYGLLEKISLRLMLISNENLGYEEKKQTAYFLLSVCVSITGQKMANEIFQVNNNMEEVDGLYKLFVIITKDPCYSQQIKRPMKLLLRRTFEILLQD